MEPTMMLSYDTFSFLYLILLITCFESHPTVWHSINRWGSVLHRPCVCLLLRYYFLCKGMLIRRNACVCVCLFQRWDIMFIFCICTKCWTSGCRCSFSTRFHMQRYRLVCCWFLLWSGQFDRKSKPTINVTSSLTVALCWPLLLLLFFPALNKHLHLRLIKLVF